MNANRAQQLKVVARLSPSARAAVSKDRWRRRAQWGWAKRAMRGDLAATPETILELVHAAVVARPRDFALRRAYADMLAPHDEPRSIFIIEQLASDRLGPPDNKTTLAIMSEQVSYTEGNKTWRGERYWGWQGFLRELDIFGRFRRGFIEEVTVKASRFVDLAPKLATMAPILSVKLTGDLHNQLPAILEQPLLRQLETLHIEDALLDRHLQAIAAAPLLRGLKTLNVGSLFAGHQGLRALAGMPSLMRFWTGRPNNPLNTLDYGPQNDDCMSLPRVRRSPLNLALEAEFGSLPWLYDAENSLMHSIRPTKRRRPN